MQLLSRIIAAAALGGLAAGSAAAQTCLGRPYFSTGPVHVGAGADMGSDVSSIAGEVGVGANRAFFGKGSVAYTRLDRDGLLAAGDPKGATFGVLGGYQFNISRGGATQFCPTAAIEWGTLDFSGGPELERSLLTVGGSIGWVHERNSGLHLVPFAGAAIGQLSRSFNDGDEDELDLGSETFFPVTAGLGVHFSNAFMVIGSAMFPVDLAGADPVFGVRMVLPLGRR
jgi:hypothetical protein